MDKKIEILKKLRDKNYELKMEYVNLNTESREGKYIIDRVKKQEMQIDILRNEILEGKAFPNCSEEEIILLDLEEYVGKKIVQN